MKTINQKGIAHLVPILALVVLVAIGSAGYYVYNRSQGQEGQTQSSKQEFVQETNDSINRDSDLITFKDVRNVDVEKLAPYYEDIISGAERYRFVEINGSLIKPTVDNPNLKIELFKDVVVNLKGEGAPQPGAGNSMVWSANFDKGYATLSLGDSQISGEIAYDGAIYRIRPINDTNTHIIFIDGRKFCDHRCED